jgi:hypothetical protein
MRLPRCVLAVGFIPVVLAFLGIGIAVSRGAGLPARWPVIGCDDTSVPYPNERDWRYAPTGYCDVSHVASPEAIDHVKWTHWGASRATGRGFYVDDLGFSYPATVTAYGLKVARDFNATGRYVAWYSRLHIRSPGGARGGSNHGPFNFVAIVGIQA